MEEIDHHEPVPAETVRERFGEYLDYVVDRTEQVQITRDGEPVAALVPLYDVELLEAFELAEDRAWLKRRRVEGPSDEDLPAD